MAGKPTYRNRARESHVDYQPDDAYSWDNLEEEQRLDSRPEDDNPECWLKQVVIICRPRSSNIDTDEHVHRRKITGIRIALAPSCITANWIVSSPCLSTGVALYPRCPHLPTQPRTKLRKWLKHPPLWRSHYPTLAQSRAAYLSCWFHLQPRCKPDNQQLLAAAYGFNYSSPSPWNACHQRKFQRARC